MASRDEDRGYLELRVQPSTARLYVDDEYRGVIERWRHQIVPLEPGLRRVEIRADGYITRRFDVPIEAGESWTLTLEMTRPLEDDPPRDSSRRARPIPRPGHDEKEPWRRNPR
jgi:hypothetical protein